MAAVADMAVADMVKDMVMDMVIGMGMVTDMVTDMVIGMGIMVVGTTVVGTPEMAATGTVAGTLMALAPVGVSHPLVGFGFAVTEQWSKKGGGVRHPLRSYLGLGADDAESVRRWRPPH